MALISPEMDILLLLLIVAFTPSIAYLIWIRGSEKQPVSAGKVLKAFLWGAIIAIIFSLILYIIFYMVFNSVPLREYEWLKKDASMQALFLAIVVAPFVEEFAKGLGVYIMRSGISELETGLVLGASSGLGFAATENFFYELYALREGGLETFILTAILRSVSSVLLHASATAWTGYGIANKRILNGLLIPYYLLAVLMHGTFNFFASFGVIYEQTFGAGAYLLGFALALSLAIFSIKYIRRKIIEINIIRARKV